jgi:N-acylglucosamine 2-epimerase
MSETSLQSHLKDELQSYIAVLQQELFESVLPFWYIHSFDPIHGGFYACLTKEGEVYDKRKLIWLNGRQVWMFSKICNAFSAEDIATLSNHRLDRSKMIEMARSSCEFMLSNAICQENQQVYFALHENGLPYTFQRKIFAACFMCLGCAGLYGVTKEDRFK